MAMAFRFGAFGTGRSGSLMQFVCCPSTLPSVATCSFRCSFDIETTAVQRLCRASCACRVGVIVQWERPLSTAKDKEARTESHRAVIEHHSDTEDEGSPVDKDHGVQIPTFAKDAPDTSNWLFARLLVSPMDIMAHKKRGSRADRSRQPSTSCRV